MNFKNIITFVLVCAGMLFVSAIKSNVESAETMITTMVNALKSDQGTINASLQDLIGKNQILKAQISTYPQQADKLRAYETYTRGLESNLNEVTEKFKAYMEKNIQLLEQLKMMLTQ